MYCMFYNNFIETYNVYRNSLICCMLGLGEGDKKWGLDNESDCPSGKVINVAVGRGGDLK